MHQLRKSIYVPSSQLPNKSWNQNQSQKQKQNIKPSTDDISDATRMRLNKPVLKLKSEFLPKSEESLSSTPNPPPQPTTVAKSQVEPASQPVLGDSYADKLKAEIMQIQNQIQQLQLQHQQQTIDSNNEFELAMQALQKPAAHFGPSADTFASPSPPPTFSVNNAVTSSMFNPQPSVNTNNITPAAVSDFFSPSPPLPTTFSSIPTSIPTSKPSITTNTTNDLSFFDPFAIKSVPSSKPSLSATAPLISNNPTFATDLFPPPPPPPPPSSSSTNPFHLHPTPIAKSSTTSNFGFASYTAASTPAPLPLQHSLTSSSTISSSNPFASSLYSQPQAPSQPQSQTQNTFTFSSATTTTHPSFSSINSAHHSTNPFLFPSSSNNNINSSANPVPNPVGISNFKNANSANTSNFADFTVFNRK
ncbi:hypothetical protein AX774_g2079 [Zancudomyces culisetae]|uniref:Uncharacterized protein n=1 Tax=Zancudomyces culisetae TaxID=1213189 RepID=A0A1R1PTT4_ZANCU|nr:hypothetical protein AX774_g2079 [Zancudomyces culisetae]|eukprot:OMH84405.1 hypothetical protein AX774_g2079 [Zancudomyces culisetae]